jgi:hypothetical protein
MRHWLRKNWLGLAAIAVLLPATLGITFAQQWTAYFSSWASAPHEVAGGTTARYSGTGWTLEGVKRISGSSAEGERIRLPGGSDLIVARLRVEPEKLQDGKSPYCTVRLQELRGDEIVREWGDAAFDPVDYEVRADAESGCTSTLTEPYLFEMTFVVPEDAGSGETELGLVLSVVDQLPDFLRLRLPE